MNDINQKLDSYIRARRRKWIWRIVIVSAIAVSVGMGLLYITNDQKTEVIAEVIGSTMIPEIKGDVRYITVRLSNGSETSVAVPDTLKGKNGHRVVLVKQQVSGSDQANYIVKSFTD